MGLRLRTTHFVFALLAVFLPAAAVSAQRLPRTVSPEHYQLTVGPDLVAARFSGEETIRVRLLEPTRSITMNAAEIEFHDVTITAGGQTHKAAVALDPKTEQVTLDVPSTLAAGPATIRITYSGTLNDDLRGLYLSKANNRRYAVTQLEATDARRMFPSFDEPEFKATFAVTAIVDAADRVISNGAILSDTPGPPGKHTVTFETTPLMSTYLVALAVGDFECNEGRADTVPVRICSTPDKKHLTSLALEFATQVVQYFNRYYSVKYPFKKLDIVAVPDFAAGAMENTAAIFYRETLLLAEPHASVSVRKQIASVLAHEIAHQWFGNLVTMKWWDDIWLNEGFATWAQSKPMKEWKPEWHGELDEARDNQTAMALDVLRSTRPIRADASTPAEISELFDPIAYEKGAAVVRMLESWIGEAEFRRAVNAYVDRFKYSNARAEDFWGTLAKVTGKPVDRVMPTFVDQPGVPLVNVSISCTNGAATIALSQERYTVTGAANPRGSTEPVWQIPVCLRLPDGKTKCDLLDHQSEVVPVDRCPAWVMANAGARGYYRTAASPEIVRRMAADVGKLQPAERIAMLADEWALVRAGRHEIGTYLDFASGLKGERSAAVVDTLVSTLENIRTELTTEHTRARFDAWVSRLLSPALAEIGWTPTAGEPDDTRAFRAAIVGALGKARDRAVLAKARALIDQELDKPASVDPTLLNVIVNLAATEGDGALYDTYLARARAATDPAERYLFLYGLASFSDPALVRRTMDLALGTDVRSQDTKLLVRAMLVADAPRGLAWDLLRARWDEVQNKTGEFVGNTVIVGALAAFCDPAPLEQVKTFFAAHDVPDAERTLQQSIERIESCVSFAEAQRGKLATWLDALK
jgi:aminopeptidase N